jgi:two-component system heavy metal sensor histidine kinase CusS
LFERFYRVDTSRSRAEGGTGLGLAIVRSIMSLHQGTVEVSSLPGSFTVFRLIFPKVRNGSST